MSSSSLSSFKIPKNIKMLLNIYLKLIKHSVELQVLCIWTKTELMECVACVLKWHKSFRTYDYSWAEDPRLVSHWLSNIATYFRHRLAARNWKSSCDIFHEPCTAIVQKPLLSWLFWTVMHQNFSLKYDGEHIHARAATVNPFHKKTFY